MYVNGYILSVPEENKDSYLRMAEVFAEIASDYGVLEIVENWEHEVPDGELTDYRKAVKALPGEKIVFSWVIWPDQETAASAHKSMFEDPRMSEFQDMPFDGKRMIMGDFKPILTYRRNDRS